MMTFIPIWCFLEPPGSISWTSVVTDRIWLSAFQAVLYLAHITHGPLLEMATVREHDEDDGGLVTNIVTKQHILSLLGIFY